MHGSALLAAAAAYMVLLSPQAVKAVELLKGEETDKPLNQGLETQFYVLSDKEKEGFQLNIKNRINYETTTQEKIVKWHVAEKEKIQKYTESKEKWTES